MGTYFEYVSTEVAGLKIHDRVPVCGWEGPQLTCIWSEQANESRVEVVVGLIPDYDAGERWADGGVELEVHGRAWLLEDPSRAWARRFSAAYLHSGEEAEQFFKHQLPDTMKEAFEEASRHVDELPALRRPEDTVNWAREALELGD